MPMIALHIGKEIPADKKETLMTQASRIVAGGMGKPEAYVMVTLQSVDTCMGGKSVPAAFVDIRGIGGIDRDSNATLSKGICALLNRELAIEQDHVYLNFSDIRPHDWGWKGATFG